jgi:cell division protein YceG involved in septum cleavage
LARDRKPEGSTQRTDAERELAREERERRRAAQGGDVAPPLPPPANHGEAAPPVPPAQVTPPVQAAPPVDDPIGVQDDHVAPSHLEGRRVHRSHLHRPHLQRPHLPRRASPARTGAARAGALLAIAVVLALLAGAAVVLIRHANRSAPPPPPKIVKVVIPEGYTEAQIATLASEDGLRGDYSKAVAHAERTGLLRPSTYGAPPGTRSLEGFLFPASYELYSATPVSHLVAQQLDAFRANFGGGEVHRAKVLGVTPYDLLIVASIVEREAGTSHDRPLVAAVVYNRLRLNMTLGVDATLRYALHDFTHPLTEHQLASKSAYNTRIHKGLPPTPISNPGAAAIRAAAHSAHVSYLYYVAGADGCGEQVFSTSYAKFEQDAAAYREALRKNGGRVPTCHKK